MHAQHASPLAVGSAGSPDWARGRTRSGAHLRHREKDARLGPANIVLVLGLGLLLQDDQRLTSKVTALLHRRGSDLAPSRVTPPPFRQEAFTRFRNSLFMRNVYRAVR